MLIFSELPTSLGFKTMRKIFLKLDIIYNYLIKLDNKRSSTNEMCTCMRLNFYFILICYTLNFTNKWLLWEEKKNDQLNFAFSLCT